MVLDRVQTARLASLTAVAPLHQPLSLALADLAAEVVSVPVVACFDTAFHARLPWSAAGYALPRRWVREHGLRRYGFHGLSYAHAVRRTAELLDVGPDDLRMVCCHIGSGVSVTAIRDGHSVDTSMGFTPLEGAVMSTRSGSVDPGLLLYLLRSGVTDVPGLEQALERSSGLAGMTGTNGDVRAVLAARAAGDPDASGAIDVYLHRLRREIGAAAVSLERLDAVVLTGGVAEHQPALMAELVEPLGVLGVAIDPARLSGTADRLISPAGAAVRVLVVTAREDLEMARQTTHVLAAMPAAR
jgi:acetate kinase